MWSLGEKNIRRSNDYDHDWTQSYSSSFLWFLNASLFSGFFIKNGQLRKENFENWRIVVIHATYNWVKMSISGVATLMENYILRKIGAIEKANDTEEEEGTRSKIWLITWPLSRAFQPNAMISLSLPTKPNLPSSKNTPDHYFTFSQFGIFFKVYLKLASQKWPLTPKMTLEKQKRRPRQLHSVHWQHVMDLLLQWSIFSLELLLYSINK